MMLKQLLWTLVLTLLTVTLHALYSAYLIHVLKRHYHPGQAISQKLGFHRLIECVISLLLLHCIETALWAAFYVYKDGFSDFATALYFSTVSYATIGYGDVVLPSSLRLLGAMEGLVGTLMAGWSVALLVGLLQVILRSQFSGNLSSDSPKL